MHDGVGGGWSPSPRSSTTSHTKHEDANKKEETGNDEDPYIIGRSQQHVQLLYTGRNIDNNHSLLTSTIDDIGMDMGSLSDAESATVSSANSCSSTNSLSSPPHRARLRHSGTASHAISMCGIVSPITTPTVPPPATAAAPGQTKLREKEEEDVERNNHNTTHHRSGTSRAIAMSGTTTTTPTPPPATVAASRKTTRREKEEEEVERNTHKPTHRHRHHRRSASWSPPTTPPQSPSPTPPAPKTTESSTSATMGQYLDNMATDDGFIANICGGLGTSTDLCNRNY